MLFIYDSLSRRAITCTHMHGAKLQRSERIKRSPRLNAKQKYKTRRDREQNSAQEKKKKKKQRKEERRKEEFVKHPEVRCVMLNVTRRILTRTVAQAAFRMTKLLSREFTDTCRRFRSPRHPKSLDSDRPQGRISQLGKLARQCIQSAEALFLSLSFFLSFFSSPLNRISNTRGMTIMTVAISSKSSRLYSRNTRASRRRRIRVALKERAEDHSDSPATQHRS